MSQPESQLKKTLKHILDMRGAFWSSVQGGAGSKPGDPDMVVCYRGIYVAIEAKTPTGRLSGWQKTRKAEIERAGGIYVVVRCVTDLAICLDRIDRQLDGAVEDEVL